MNYSLTITTEHYDFVALQKTDTEKLLTTGKLAKQQYMQQE